MKYLKLLLEAGIMAGGLLLVIITLSGSTRDVAVVVSVVSIILFLMSGLFDQDDEA